MVLLFKKKTFIWFTWICQPQQHALHFPEARKYKVGKAIANQAILAHKYCWTQTFPCGDPLGTFLLDIAGKGLFLFKKICHKA